MSTPVNQTVSNPTPPVSSAARIVAVAVVTKKASTLRFSPKSVESTHPYREQGFAYMAVEVSSNTPVKGFPDEESCQKFCEKMNNE